MGTIKRAALFVLLLSGGLLGIAGFKYGPAIVTDFAWKDAKLIADPALRVDRFRCSTRVWAVTTCTLSYTDAALRTPAQRKAGSTTQKRIRYLMVGWMRPGQPVLLRAARDSDVTVSSVGLATLGDRIAPFGVLVVILAAAMLALLRTGRAAGYREPQLA
jgi:hypothetical protein